MPIYGNSINGKRMKRVMDEINLEILNCVWDSMNGATWFSEKSAFTIDYIGVDNCALKCVDNCALKCVESTYMIERGSGRE